MSTITWKDQYEKSSESESFNKDVSITTEERKTEKKRMELGIIEKGAVGQYLQDASRNRFGAIASGTFYLTGILILLYIITTQIINIVTAAWG